MQLNKATGSKSIAVLASLICTVACVPPKDAQSTISSSSTSGRVVGHSIKSHNCTDHDGNGIKSCDFTYALKVKLDSGKTIKIPVDVLVHARCRSRDRWPSCANR